MATVPWLGSKATSVRALRAAVDLGELLAVFGALAPTSPLAALVAWWALSLWKCEVVHVEELCSGTRDDLVPVDGLHVTQVVIVEHRYSALQDVCNNKKLSKEIFYEENINNIKVQPCHSIIE